MTHVFKPHLFDQKVYYLRRYISRMSREFTVIIKRYVGYDFSA